MSNKTAAQATKQINNSKLNCNKCSKSLNEPKLLPCFHVFCKLPCLEELAAQDPEGKTLTCPTCGHLATLPDSGVAGLPMDFQVEYLFKQKIACEKADTPNCDNCKESEATKFCQQCGKFMCDKCREKHMQMWEAFKNHTLLSTDQVKDNAIEILAPKQILKCEKHPKMELRMFCETCSELICSDCLIAFHKGHTEYNLVDQVFPSQREKLESTLEPLEGNLEKVEYALEALTIREGEIDNQKDKIEALIEKEIEEIQQVLNQRKEQLLASLNEHTQEKKQILATQKTEVKNTQKTMSSCLEYAKAGLETGTAGEVLRMMGPVLKRIEEISAEFDPGILQPKTEADIELQTEDNTRLHCQEFGKVVCDPVSAENSYTTGNGTKFARLETPATVEVQPITGRNMKCSHNFHLTATLEHCSSKTTLLCNVSQKNGRHTITYQPLHRGRHSLHIRANGRHIQGSPYPIAVAPSMRAFSYPKKIFSGKKAKTPQCVAIISKQQKVLAWHKSCASIYDSKGNEQTFGAHNTKRGSLSSPNGVTVDQEGTIYIADQYSRSWFSTLTVAGDCIQKFTPDGKFIAVAGHRGSNELEFNNPVGICFNKTDQLLYVCDRDNHRIQVLTTDLTFVRAFGENGNGDGQFNCPLNIAFDSDNNLYVTDCGNNRVQVFTAEGQFLRAFSNKASGATLVNPNAIAIDSSNVVYVSETDLHCVSLFTTHGDYIDSFGELGNERGQFNGITGLCIDLDDSIVVVDSINKRLQFF